MTAAVLFVDDDPLLLDTYRRLFGRRFTVDVAQGPQEGFTAVAERGPFAVVVSDMRMPGMDGVQFLSRIREQAPDSVRIMLTGNADLETATEAVNEGHIFRFLTKPCPRDVLTKTLEQAVEQHRLVTAERELLTKTLTGAIKVLADVLSLVQPVAFGRAARVRRWVRKLADAIQPPRRWEIEIAAMLCQVGTVATPAEVWARLEHSADLTPAERETLSAYPRLGHELIAHVPRLEGAAEIVLYQQQPFTPWDPSVQPRGAQIPLGARLIKVAHDFDAALTAHRDLGQALRTLQAQPQAYDPDVLAALAEIVAAEIAPLVRAVTHDRLNLGDVLAEDVFTRDGALLVGRGTEVTASLLSRMRSHARAIGLAEPLYVYDPTTTVAV